MIVWMIGWSEPQVLDMIIYIMMAPRVSLEYMAWWIRVHLGPLGLVESGSSDRDVSHSSKDGDHMDVDNPIHNGSSLGGDKVGDLDVFIVVTLALGDKDITCS